MKAVTVPRAGMALALMLFVGTAGCGGAEKSAGTPEQREAIDTIVDTEPKSSEIRLVGSGVFLDVASATGASLSALGPDGTSYVLDIPPGALPYDTVVSLTPAEGDGFVGVGIEPDGMWLKSTATLTMTPPAESQPGQALWWDGFGVVGPEIAPTTATNDRVFVLSHFSGYGQTTSPGASPERTPLDEWADTTTQYTGEVARGGEMSDVDRTILEDNAQAIFADYLKPLVNRASGTCAARRAFLEALRFQKIAQALGLDVGDEAMTFLDSKAPAAYESMKKCAKQQCEAGNLDAGAQMLSAVVFGQAFGVAAAEKDGPVVFQEVLGVGMSSPWVKCRILTFSMYVTGTTTLQLMGASPTTLMSTAAALGRLMPGPDGQTGDVGMWLSGTGYDDSTELSGFYSLFMGQAPMDGLTSCSAGSFPHGLVTAKVTWGDDNLPSLEFTPMVSKMPVTCAKIGEVPTPSSAFYFAGVPAAVAAGGFVTSLTHRFTAAEAWPTASDGRGAAVALGYVWKETIDIAPQLAAEGISVYSVAKTEIYAKIAVGSANSPAIESPGSAGLVNGFTLE